MPKTIFDYKASVPTSGSQTLNRNIPTSPTTIKLAAFGLFVPEQTDFVDLQGTIGIQATALNPSILIKVFRDTGVIFTSRISIDADLAEFQTVSFQAIDISPPAGFYSYSVTAELVASAILDSATVVGPVSFKGFSIGNA
ncbi:hypothetical protein Q9251_08010 [Alkalihalobacillus macyae]|uniref:hypothetical protein n=1 Tax=Guptibacillus hwajinpoensis TaxID=208199 RepID=UPI00273AD4D1|nr:hypothetical protein [Alkalihalobacillus macyae]MDP4550827.1 hypothetical protein [Alkalihalobacillus macyae]